MVDKPVSITEAQYYALIEMIDGWMDAAPDSAEELMLVYAVGLVEAYEEEDYPIEESDNA